MIKKILLFGLAVSLLFGASLGYAADDRIGIWDNTAKKWKVIADGTANYIMKTSGAGVLSWTANITGNAATVTNATFTTALTVDTGTVGLTGAGANTSVLTLAAGASSISGANTGDNSANSSSTYIGTTAVALNRASAALELAGITLTTPTFIDTALISGTTPALTIGDAGTEDTKVVFDGNEQDYYMGLDDTDNEFKIGLGSVVGTTPYEEITPAGIITNASNSGARAYLGASQLDFADNTDTKILLNIEAYDIQGEFVPYTDTVATQARFTATVAGYYLVTAHIGLTTCIADKSYYGKIFKNGSAYQYFMFAPSKTTWVGCNMADVIYLAIGDYIELFLYPDAVGAATTDAFGGNVYTTNMSINKIR